ncbi:SpoIIE family protein phosphatase [Streptomyces specialis]|uniref:SpoIIE family protein phosphatase n=1 Tax=Streptomyces specialis TaxID=498367 RepID=UPI00073E1341|nr:SpoIIE family protein phosphatase [Streptomyces specialis]
MIAPDADGRAGRSRPPETRRARRGLPDLPDLPDLGVYVVDDEGRIVDVNRRAETLLRRDAADLLGQDAHDLLHRDSSGHSLPRAQCPMMHAFLDRRTVQADRGWFQRGDGSPLPMAWMVTPYEIGGKAAGAMVLFHETTSAEVTEWERHDPAAPLSELDRLALLAETTTLLTSTLDTDEALRRLVRLVVPRLADWAVVDLITEHGEVWRTAVVGHDNGVLAPREDLQGPMPPVPPESPMPLSRALRGAASTLAGPENYQGPPDSGIAVAQAELFRATGMHSAAIAPIRGLREVIGALTLGRSGPSGAFGGVELSLLNDICRRAGLALDNARLYQRQRRVAETMQRHLLPQLPDVPGLEMTARYVPAPQASQVGGDWYDAFVLPNGVTALAIGDVVGHDLDAAAGMAQVRNMLRAHAWSHGEPPSSIVERLEQSVVHLAEASLATLVFGQLEQLTDGTWQLRWTNAGHPPPLLIEAAGQSRFLDAGAGLLLGTGIAAVRTDAVVCLPPLATLVFYTDGLVESPGRSIDEGLARLRRHAAALAHRPLDTFCDLLLDRVRPVANEDDVALLALRIPVPGGTPSLRPGTGRA